MEGTEFGTDWLVRGTIRLAVVLILIRVLFETLEWPSRRVRAALWVVAWAFYLGHLVAAYGAVHDWSESQAWNRVADQTEALTGVRTGAGLWVNHAFTIVWTLDVIRLLVRTFARSKPAREPPKPSRRSRFSQVHRLWTGFVATMMTFVIINATVVFGPPLWWVVAGVWGVAMASALAWRRSDRETPAASGRVTISDRSQ